MVSGVEGILTVQYIYSHENVFVWQNTLHSDYVQNKTIFIVFLLSKTDYPHKEPTKWSRNKSWIFT